VSAEPAGALVTQRFLSAEKSVQLRYPIAKRAVSKLVSFCALNLRLKIKKSPPSS
jgi:hypothetical protein